MSFEEDSRINYDDDNEPITLMSIFNKGKESQAQTNQGVMNVIF